MYLSQTIQPKVAFDVNKLEQYMADLRLGY